MRNKLILAGIPGRLGCISKSGPDEIFLCATKTFHFAEIPGRLGCAGKVWDDLAVPDGIPGSGYRIAASSHSQPNLSLAPGTDAVLAPLWDCCGTAVAACCWPLLAGCALLPACCGLVLLAATPGTCAVLAVFQKGNSTDTIFSCVSGDISGDTRANIYRFVPGVSGRRIGSRRIRIARYFRVDDIGQHQRYYRVV